MRLEQLAYLVEISRTHSISLAAENLFITQQSMSQALGKLEEELGVVLFTRHYRGITLTLEGEKATKRAQIILKHVQKLKEELQPVALATLAGELILYISDYINQMLSSSTEIMDFYTQNPNLRIRTVEHASMDIPKAMLNDPQAIGIISAHQTEINELMATYATQLHFTILAEEPLFVFLSKLLPLAEKERISLADVADYPIAVNARASYFTYTFQDESLKLSTVQYYSEPICRRMISEGKAISFITKSLFCHSSYSTLKTLKLIPLEGKNSITIALVLHNNTPLSLPGQSFIRLFKGIYQKYLTDY